MIYKIFIDGAEGTTGLKIHKYFEKRDDVQVLAIEESKRKDLDERLKMIKQADLSFLCLPDAAAREIAAAAPKECRILDTSTAHRTDPEWVYGMPEISAEQREKIRTSNRVAVPGCHASGVILLTMPLIRSGIVSADYPFAAFSLTGYSGGGKKMIADYEAGNVSRSPRQYSIAQHHKHLPEIVKVTGMSSAPAFMPVVADYFKGMEVTVPLKGTAVSASDDAELNDILREKGPKAAVEAALGKAYAGQNFVSVVDSIDENGFIAADRMASSNRVEIAVEGNDENILLVAVYDNLGKGASGAAVQNMNIMLGIDETKGLI